MYRMEILRVFLISIDSYDANQNTIMMDIKYITRYLPKSQINKMNNVSTAQAGLFTEMQHAKLGSRSSTKSTTGFGNRQVKWAEI